MNPTALKLTDEIAAAMSARVRAFEPEADLVGLSYTDIVAGATEKAKKVQADNGTFDVIISTESVDRSGEIVRQDGWDLGNYKHNPIVLWGHDYYSLGIGVCLETYSTTFRGMPALGARGVFYSEDINPLAQQVRRMYDFGLKLGVGAGCTTSVGFIPKDFDPKDQSIITRAELLEFSFVPVPAQQDVGPAAGRSLTLAEAGQIGLDVFAMRVKGMIFAESKSAEIGDSCEMDDGTPGTLVTDPKDPDGALVCLPIESDKTAPTESGDEPNDNEATKAFHKKVMAEHGRHTKAIMKAIADFSEKAAAIDAAHAPEGDDDEKNKAAKESAHNELMKCLKSMKAEMGDENGGHRAANIKSFRSFTPPEEKDDKSFDIEKSLGALRDEHDAYEAKCSKSIDEFEEKAFAGNPGNESTDWVTGKMAGHQEKHLGAVTKCAKAMDPGFGEGEDTGEKRWWTKASVADELAESQERQQKYQKVNGVWDIFDAFICAYLDDSTPVADFEKLLDEAVGLMKSADSKGAKGLIKFYMESEVKAGAKLSAATKAKIAEAHGHIMKGAEALAELHGGLGGEPKPEEKEPEEKTEEKPVHDASASEELESFIATRDLARALSGSLNEMLSKSKGSNGTLRDLFQKSKSKV